MNEVVEFMHRLSDFLGNSDGQTIEEVRAELCEEMGEEKFLEAEKQFLQFIENQKGHKQ